MNIKIFLLPVFLLITFLISSNHVFAKGAESERMVVYLNLKLDNGEIYTIEGDGKQVITPGSNFLRTYKFKVPESVMDEIDFGAFANKIIGVRIKLETGETLTGVGFLNKAGVLTFTVHWNGAGGTFPKGWF